MDSISFEPYDEKYLELSWKWLRDPELKQLTLTPDFDRESQRNWFDSLNNKEDYFLFGVLYDGKAIGVCGLKNIANNEGEYWGYIGEKSYWGKGIGKNMLDHIISFAITRNLSSIFLKVWSGNTRAINLYKKNGFKIISEKENLCIMNKLLK